MGLAAFGGVAIGVLAIGGSALGVYAAGGAAVGKEIGSRRRRSGKNSCRDRRRRHPYHAAAAGYRCRRGGSIPASAPSEALAASGAPSGMVRRLIGTAE